MPSYDWTITFGGPEPLPDDLQKGLPELLGPKIDDLLKDFELSHVIVGPVVAKAVLGSHTGGGLAAQLNLLGNMPDFIKEWHKSSTPPTLVEMAKAAPGIPLADGTPQVVFDNLTDQEKEILEKISNDSEQSAAIINATRSKIAEYEAKASAERATLASAYAKFSTLPEKEQRGLAEKVGVRCLIGDRTYKGEVEVLVNADTSAVTLMPKPLEP